MEMLGVISLTKLRVLVHIAGEKMASPASLIITSVFALVYPCGTKKIPF